MTDTAPDFDAALALIAEHFPNLVRERVRASSLAAGLPGWMQPQLAREADEDRAARRREYDEWALRYADSGVRVPDRQHEAGQAGAPEAEPEAEAGL
jgi:hypothetical protein